VPRRRRKNSAAYDFHAGKYAESPTAIVTSTASFSYAVDESICSSLE
jgi:hypothetical protein